MGDEKEVKPTTTPNKGKKTNQDENNVDSVSLLDALLAVQDELPVVGKATEGFNYKYANIETVWDAIQPILQKHGFAVTHEITAEGVLTYASHASGVIKSFIPFTPGLTKPQEVGSEITYFKRYNIVSIFNVIVADEDDDAATAQAAVSSPKEIMDKLEDNLAPKCPKCGAKMLKRNSARGPFWGCSKYPKCNGTLSTEEADKKSEDEIVI